MDLIDFKATTEYNRIFLFHKRIPNRIVSRESNWLEFKESFNWGSKDRYGKSIVSFANNKGGFLIFGVQNQPRSLIGLKSNNFEKLDEKTITEYLNSVFSPEVDFSKFIVSVKRRIVGVIYIYSSHNKPIVCIKNSGDLRESEIYYRYNAISGKIKYPELKAIMESIKENERKTWMEHLERISKIGSTNAAVMDTLSGTITGAKGALIIDKELIPKLRFIREGDFRKKGRPVLKLIGDVRPFNTHQIFNKEGVDIRITDNPNAPSFKIDENTLIKQFPLGRGQLFERLEKRFKNLVRNKEFFETRLKIMKKYPTLWRERLLYPNNPKGAKTIFFNEKIVKKFDKYYKKK